MYWVLALSVSGIESAWKIKVSLLTELKNDFIIIGANADSKSISVSVLCEPSFLTLTSPLIACGRPPKYSITISWLFENNGDSIVKTPDFPFSVCNNAKEESDVASRLIDDGKPSKKYSGSWYISGFTPSASNDWVSVSADGLIDV